MSFELTSLLNRCTKEDAAFLISVIDSYIAPTSDKMLKKLLESWEGDGPMPKVLNHDIEREIRYLGSNDIAYMYRKLRGYDPAGVGVDEIIDDLCKLLNLDISTAHTLEARLEIFAGKFIDQQFANLPDEEKRKILEEILEKIGVEQHQFNEILDEIIKNKEMLLAVLLQLLQEGLTPKVVQTLLLSIIGPLVGDAAATILAQIATQLPAGPVIGALAIGLAIKTLLGPASRKTIPLVLYLGFLSFRDGATKEFTQSLAIR